MQYRFFSVLDHKEDIVAEGMQAAGFGRMSGILNPRPGDWILAWNRKGRNVDMIEQFERAGGTAVIIENGYIGTDDKGNRLISIAFHKHLGLGQWPIENTPRKNYGETLPWRERGNDVVILAQRGIGFTSVDESWALEMQQMLKEKTRRKVRIRWHPGKDKTKPLYEDIKDAHAVVTYSSAAGIQAIAMGIPCFHMMEGWIGKDASAYGIADIEKPFLSWRGEMLHKVSWAQWTQDEVRAGLPFKYMVQMYENGLVLPNR